MMTSSSETHDFRASASVRSQVSESIPSGIGRGAESGPHSTRGVTPVRSSACRIAEPTKPLAPMSPTRRFRSSSIMATRLGDNHQSLRSDMRQQRADPIAKGIHARALESMRAIFSVRGKSLQRWTQHPLGENTEKFATDDCRYQSKVLDVVYAQSRFSHQTVESPIGVEPKVLP